MLILLQHLGCVKKTPFFQKIPSENETKFGIFKLLFSVLFEILQSLCKICINNF